MQGVHHFKADQPSTRDGRRQSDFALQASSPEAAISIAYIQKVRVLTRNAFVCAIFSD